MIQAQDVSEKKQNKALEHYQKGISFVQKNELKKAEKMFEKALSDNPNLDKAYIALGELYIGQAADGKDKEMYRRGAQCYRYAIHLEPQNLHYLHAFLSILVDWQKVENKTELYDECLEVFETIEGLSGDDIVGNVEFYCNWAEILIRKCKADGSLGENEDEIISLLFKGINENHAASIYWLVVYYVLIGDMPKALQWMEEVVLRGDLTREEIENDSYFKKLRKHADCKAMLDYYYWGNNLNKGADWPQYGEKIKITEKKRAADDASKVFEICDELPSYPGGKAKMVEFMNENVRLPIDVVRYGAEVSLAIHFVVERDGKIGNIELLRSGYHSRRLSDPYFKESVRLVKMMPRWIPGKQKGKNVAAYVTLPFYFKQD